MAGFGQSVKSFGITLVPAFSSSQRDQTSAAVGARLCAGGIPAICGFCSTCPFPSRPRPNTRLKLTALGVSGRIPRRGLDLAHLGGAAIAYPREEHVTGLSAFPGGK